MTVQPPTWAWRLLVAEAMLWLALAQLVLRLVPFRRLAVWLGPARRPGPPDAAAGLPPDSLRRIGRAVERAAQRMPWPALCLAQAMAAKAMLARRGVASAVHFGARPDEAGIAAHAWLMAGPVAVIGAAGRSNFAELGRFG